MKDNVCRIIKINKEALFEFIFLAHNGEDAEENIIPFPKNIDIKKVMNRLPETTDSVLNSTKNYKELTFDELRSLSNG